MNVKFNKYGIIETINNIKVYSLFINIKRFSDLVHGIYYYEDVSYFIYDEYGTLYHSKIIDKSYKPIASLHVIDYNDSVFDNNIIIRHEIKNKDMLKQCTENALFDISINKI